jgi:hypothetical protein
MADEATPGGPKAVRGEAAWKAAKERVEERNAQARKAGKAVRQAQDQKAAERRLARDLRERAALREL